MRSAVCALLALAGCGQPLAGDGSDGGSGGDRGGADLGAPVFDLALFDLGHRELHGTWRLTLDAGAYPPTSKHPSALVYIPTGFDPTPPLSVIVYFHGFNNCVDNIIRDAGRSCDPDAGTPVRSAYALAAQLEASNKNAILLCPELVFDQAMGAPGNLGKVDGFRALLVEVLRDLPELGTASLTDVGTVVVATHSGGYQAAAALLDHGGVPIVEAYLLDSLYGNDLEFEKWIKQDLPSLAGSPPHRRFADVYTSGGGTALNSQDMAIRAAGWLPPDSGILVDDRTTSTWPPEMYLHGLLFKHTSLQHDQVPRYYFGPLVGTSRLPDKP